MYSYKDKLDEVPSYLMRVKREAKQLIQNQVWDCIDNDRLEAWMNNFITDEERLLSGLLLESLICRSKKQTKALLYNSIESVLPNALNENPWKVLDNESYLSCLTSREVLDKTIKIVPVIRDTDPPTKSGPALARLYKRDIDINEWYIKWPWQVEEYYEKKGLKTVIFIDDVLGTGTQFNKFYEKHYSNMRGQIKFVYIPLLASEKGIGNVKKSFPEIKISAVEVIKENDCFFTRKNSPNISEIKDIKDLYLKVEKNKIKKRFLEKFSLGYGELALTVSFSHATPNATLPLYWYESENFKPLVRR